MEIKLFYRTQRDLAIAINELVDSYWKEEIQEDEFLKKVKLLYEHNEEKLIKNNTFTTVAQQQCGKRRLSVVRKIINV